MEKDNTKVRIQFPMIVDGPEKLSRIRMMLTEDWHVANAVQLYGQALLILETEILESERKRVVKYLQGLEKADEELAEMNALMPGVR